MRSPDTTPPRRMRAHRQPARPSSPCTSRNTDEVVFGETRCGARNRFACVGELHRGCRSSATSRRPHARLRSPSCDVALAGSCSASVTEFTGATGTPRVFQNRQPLGRRSRSEARIEQRQQFILITQAIRIEREARIAAEFGVRRARRRATATSFPCSP